MDYLFESDTFGISQEAFHLLRSRFNFKTYQAQEISQITIEQGRQVNNWLIILVIGLGLVCFAIYYSFVLYNMLTDDSVTSIYIEELLIPILPFLLGFYCIYAALKTGPTLRVDLVNYKNKRFPLLRLKKNNEIDRLIEVIKNHPSLSSKLVVKI